MTTLQEAYDMIDRVLRNTLYDDDYAEHSAALDLLSSSALAQQGEQQPVAWYEYNQDLDAWFLAYGHNPKAKTRPLVFGDTAAPAPQAQPVAQPLTNSCHTCDHYQQGKRPGVSIHDDTCYGCSEYYANKWEAKT